MTTTNTTTQIDLAAITRTYFSNKAAEKKANSIAYVENEIIPMLIKKAETGSRFCQIKPAANTDSDEIIKAIQQRVKCDVSYSGYMGKISISW